MGIAQIDIAKAQGAAIGQIALWRNLLSHSASHICGSDDRVIIGPGQGHAHDALNGAAITII